MIPNDIKWFDGCGSSGKIVLEVCYRDETKAYLKGSLDRIYEYYDLLPDCPNVVELVMYNVNGKEMVRKVCLTNLLTA